MWLEQCSTLYRLLGKDKVVWGFAPVAHLREGRLCGQSARGACRSEGLVTGEHVPDRLGELAGELDLGDMLHDMLGSSAGEAGDETDALLGLLGSGRGAPGGDAGKGKKGQGDDLLELLRGMSP